MRSGSSLQMLGHAYMHTHGQLLQMGQTFFGTFAGQRSTGRHFWNIYNHILCDRSCLQKLLCRILMSWRLCWIDVDWLQTARARFLVVSVCTCMSCAAPIRLLPMQSIPELCIGHHKQCSAHVMWTQLLYLLNLHSVLHRVIPCLTSKLYRVMPWLTLKLCRVSSG